MNEPLRIVVSRDGRELRDYEIAGGLQLGRQKETEEQYLSLTQLGEGEHRLVIAHVDENGIHRKHIHLKRLVDGRIQVRHQGEGRKNPVWIDGEAFDVEFVEKDQRLELRFPNGVLVNVNPEIELKLDSLSELTKPPFSSEQHIPHFPTFGDQVTDASDFIVWLTKSIDVIQRAATSDTFFERAARALVDMVRLDCGRVLLRTAGQWKPKAEYIASPLVIHKVRAPSNRMLNRLLEEKNTFWESPSESNQDFHSLSGLALVVASPILNRNGDVIGVLYGDRVLDIGRNETHHISRQEGLLVKLLACSVAAGLARIEEENAALTARGRFEQFFTPELARKLAEQPDLVEQGRECEVTILFCDLRGFSRISEKLGPARTATWLNSVMDALSKPVRENEGVLVEYTGDGLIAMWGAPEEQSDQAERACNTALAMLAALPPLNDRWMGELGEPTRLGIGINTGTARVGNLGSQYKLKYGPMGPCVNLASRILGATAYFHTDCLITAATKERLGPDDKFCVRRLAHVLPAKMNENVEIFELLPKDCPGWTERQTQYESALNDFKERTLVSAAETLARLLSAFPDDGPTRLLLRRAVEEMDRDPKAFNPVYPLPGK